MSNRWKKVRSPWTDSLTRIGWEEFERRIADHYRTQGYRVEHTGTGATSGRSDGGIDLKLFRDGEYAVVQCKHWNAAQVPHNAVHELIGVMHTQGANRAVIITSGEFTTAAKDSAVKVPEIQLIAGAEVRTMLGVIPEPVAPIPQLNVTPSWAPATKKVRRTRRPSRNTFMVKAIGAIAISIVGSIYIQHVIASLQRSMGHTVQQNVNNARRSIGPTTASRDRNPYRYSEDVRGSGDTKPPLTTFARSSKETVSARQPVIVQPKEGAGFKSHSTSLKDDTAEWDRENAKTMKILEKTTPEL